MSGHCCCSCSGRGSCSCCCLSPLLLQSRGTISSVSLCPSCSSSSAVIQRRCPPKTALFILRQARCCCGCRRPTARRLHCAANRPVLRSWLWPLRPVDTASSAFANKGRRLCRQGSPDQPRGLSPPRRLDIVEVAVTLGPATARTPPVPSNCRLPINRRPRSKYRNRRRTRYMSMAMRRVLHRTATRIRIPTRSRLRLHYIVDFSIMGQRAIKPVGL